MPNFSQEKLQNRAYISRAGAFNAQLPLAASAGTRLGPGADVPPAVEVCPDGSVKVCFAAESAKEVCVRIANVTYPMEKDDSGIWHGVLPYTTPGFRAIFFTVDGVEVMNPMAPIGFGWSKPINYVEFPEENEDFYELKPVPHGTVAEEIYFSSVTGQYESCLLYLPPDYMTGNRDYPVLYLQHGHGENERCWIYQGKANFIMDNLIAAGQAESAIIVMNNGMVHATRPDGSPCMNSSLLEDVLLKDCIPYIESRYRVRPGRENRGIAGLSMGSMQASIISLRHPELFAWVGIFSGFLRSFMPTDDNSHLQALDDGDIRSRYRLFFRAIGDSDGFLPIFLEDSGILEQKKLDPEHWDAHKVYRYPGEHEWQVWRKTLRDFAQLMFKAGKASG